MPSIEVQDNHEALFCGSWPRPRSSDQVLIPGDTCEFLTQVFEARSLLGVSAPAAEHQLVYVGWALQRAGHAVAGIHPQEGFMIGHAWVGHLPPAENFMKKNSKRPDIRLDGVMPSGKCLRCCPFVGDIVLMGKVDVLLW